MNFEVLWLFMKVFFTKFGSVASVGSTGKQSAKVFSAKIVFSGQFTRVFSLKLFLPYGICTVYTH